MPGSQWGPSHPASVRDELDVEQPLFRSEFNRTNPEGAVP